MKATDEDIKQYVEEELEWEPNLDATDVAVAVRDGVVTLTGFVRSYSEQYAAEVAAKRVAGVVAIANDIEVRLPATSQRPDPEIARDAVAAIKNQLPLAGDNIKVLVERGSVTLEGDVDWNYQRERAATAVRHLKGVRGVTNRIRLKPHPAPAEIKRRIEEAFARSAAVDAKHIRVSADGGMVELEGTVRSWAERDEAERIAWMAPGVVTVDNQIVVRP